LTEPREKQATNTEKRNYEGRPAKTRRILSFLPETEAFTSARGVERREPGLAAASPLPLRAMTLPHLRHALLLAGVAALLLAGPGAFFKTEG